MRFTIPKGRDFYCEFTIKEEGANVPKDVTGATGTFTLFDTGYNPCIVINGKPMAVVDGPNGIMSVTLTADETKDLKARRGFAEDGYPLLPTYKAVLDINADHKIYVEIPKVYINDTGESCLATTL